MPRQLEIVCPGEADTRLVGSQLGRLLAPGDLVLLFGDLGSGKTVFVRGLAAGLGVDPAEVASPTFALVHEYGPVGRPALIHADFYRLAAGSDADVEELDLDEVAAGAVLAIEWPRSPYLDRLAWRVGLREIASARAVSLTRG